MDWRLFRYRSDTAFMAEPQNRTSRFALGFSGPGARWVWRFYSSHLDASKIGPDMPVLISRFSAARSAFLRFITSR